MASGDDFGSSAVNGYDHGGGGRLTAETANGENIADIYLPVDVLSDHIQCDTPTGTVATGAMARMTAPIGRCGDWYCILFSINS